MSTFLSHVRICVPCPDLYPMSIILIFLSPCFGEKKEDCWGRECIIEMKFLILRRYYVKKNEHNEHNIDGE